MRFVLAGLFIALAALTPTAFGAEQVTMRTMLEEMTDLDALTKFPDPPYACRQFSSYNRASTDPSVATEANWFANRDRGQFLREEERNGATEYVLMDADGPGAIVRIWSANPDEAGVIRIYIDENPDPVIEVPMVAMLGGTVKPFVSPICGTRGQGWNSYLPIPYAKHCKVTASKPGFFYHINYRTYPENAEVRSCTPAAIDRLLPTIESAAAALRHPARFTRPEKPSVWSEYASIPAGETFEKKLSGPSAIRRMTVRVDGNRSAEVLRGTLLEITFDGEDEPAVQAPVGDFFGTAPGANEYASLPEGVLADGTLYAHWVMPFKKRATLKLTNTRDEDITMAIEVLQSDYEWTDRSMYFHAKWRSDYPIATRPMTDYNYATLEGKGVFVGDMLHVTNPVVEWWGEGDEKIYLDGETFPSTFGTGSEDYYGYAWCSPILFTHAYHNQIRCDGPSNYGHTCVSRFHILDKYPFEQSFKFDIEIWHWVSTEVGYAVTSYWYAFPGTTDNFDTPSPEELKIITPPPRPKAASQEGAIEGEDLIPQALTGGEILIQADRRFNWSGDGQVWWRGAAPGDHLTLLFSAPKPGPYEVYAAFTNAHDYGTFRVTVNREKAMDSLDLYSQESAITPALSLGTHQLSDAGNQLTVELTGKRPAAAPSYMFGLDYITLQPAMTPQ